VTKKIETGLPPVAELPPADVLREWNGAAIPSDATHFRLKRHPTKERLTFGDRDGVVVYEWPLSELSAPELLRRHGPGLYRIQWFSRFRDGSGKLEPRGQTPAFELKAPRVATVPSPPANDAGFVCCGATWPDAARFCAVCGKPRGALAAPPPAVPMAGAGPEMFMAGMQMAMSMFRDMNQVAQHEADRRVAKEQHDHEVRMQRERQQFELDLKAQAMRYDRMMHDAGQSAPADATVIAAQVAQHFDKRFEELEAQLDEVAENAEESVEKVESTVSKVMAVAEKFGPMLAPLASALATKVAGPVAGPAIAAAVNGAAHA